MRAPVHLLIFDGFADWEPALACAEVNKCSKFHVRTVGFSRDKVTSMAGLAIMPDMSIAELQLDESAMLILPGGDRWEGDEDQRVSELLQRFWIAQVPIALICGATIAGARAGLLNTVLHTSNFDGYLAKHAERYSGNALFRDTPAIADHNVVTASGMGSVEFAFEVLRLLKIYDEEDLKLWLTIYRDKVVPRELQM